MKEEKRPLFSVIIPVYNVAPYLRQCLDTLLPQTDADVQVVIIDDGSGDESGMICDEYAQAYTNVEVVHQINAGVAAARNRGLELSRGEYLLWVDPDDWVAENMISAISAAIGQNSPDMVIYDYAQWRAGTEISRKYGRSQGRQEMKTVISDLARDWRLTSVLWNKAIHRRFFDGIHFDESLRCMEDYAVLYGMILKMKHIEYLNKELYVYRIREDGLVRSPNLEVGFESFKQSVKRMRSLEEAGMGRHILGTMLQAKGFCCKYYISAMPKTYRKQYKLCRRHLLCHAAWIILDKELPLKEKVKYLLIPFSLVGRVYAAKAADIS